MRNNALKKLVLEFQEKLKPNLEKELHHYKPGIEYSKVLVRVCGFESDLGKKHPHQHRIRADAQAALTSKLNTLSIQSLKSFKNFKQLHDHLDKTLSKISGIGPLAVYDTALRLGFHVDIYPDDIYLHAGALQGAKALKISTNYSHIIKKKDFPAEMQVLTETEIESFLCNNRRVFRHV